MVRTLHILYILASLLFFVWQIRKHNDTEILPSLVWFLLMALSFAVQMNTFSEQALAMQFFGISFIGVCLMIGDAAHAPVRPVQNTRDTTPRALLFDYKIYVVLFIAISLWHISLLTHIPLWEKYVHHVKDEKMLQMMREETSKLLAVPAVFKYVFNWSINIIAPVGTYLLIARQKRWIAGIFAFFCLAYANMSLAKVPTVIMIVSITMIVVWHLSSKTRMRLYLALLVVIIPCILYASWSLARNSNSIFNYEPPKDRIEALDLAPDDPRKALTYGDKSRLKPRTSEMKSSFTEGIYDYVVYRVFLGPADVSSRWYQYFPEYSGGYIGLQGIIPGTQKAGYMHPAQRVGNWAYTERFPEWYLVTAHAYASLDADAYARFGVTGIVLAGLCILAIRIALKHLYLYLPVMRALYVIGVVMLALLLPMASLQALLIANGLLVVLILLLIYRWLYRSDYLKLSGV